LIVSFQITVAYVYTMNILFADTAHPFLEQALTNAGHTCFYEENLDRKLALEIMHQFDGVVIRSRFRFDKEMLDATNNLKFIARVGAGMENIDQDYAESLGIACLNAPEGNCNAVAEQALGMLLALFNNLMRADRELREGIWKREENRGVELTGKTIAIIGYGHTGSTFAKRLRGFDVKILVVDPYKSGYGNEYVEESTMDKVFEEADIVSLHVPLNDETRYLVNTDFINRFRKNIYVLNTSRGKCLNTADLVEALERGKVLGAALDVMEFETLSFEQLDEIPAPLKALIESDKTILTPHIAGWTHESNLKMAQILVKKIEALGV
jgi:D-3-phosphoglycerate dehydrogenase